MRRFILSIVFAITFMALTHPNTGFAVPAGPVISDEKLESLCKDKNFESCASLASRYYFRDKSYDKAIPLYNAACDAGEKEACLNLGDASYAGIGLEKNINSANEYYKRACNLGDGYICHLLAEKFQTGTSVSRDETLSNYFINQSCQKDDVSYCLDLRKYCADTQCEKSLTQKAYNKLYDRCENLSMIKECEDLSLLYLQDFSLSPNLKMSKVFLGKARKIKPSFTNFSDDDYIIKDYMEIYSFNLRCHNGDAASCYKLGQLFNEDTNHAKPNFKKSCDKNYAAACNDLAWVYEMENHHINAMPKTSFKLYEKACDLKYADACNSLATYFSDDNSYISSGNPSNINISAQIKYINLACKYGTIGTCQKYITICEKNGSCAEDELKAAFSQSIKQCEIEKSYDDCVALVEIYKNKSSIYFNKQKAKKYNNLALVYKKRMKIIEVVVIPEMIERD